MEFIIDIFEDLFEDILEGIVKAITSTRKPKYKRDKNKR